MESFHQSIPAECWAWVCRWHAGDRIRELKRRAHGVFSVCEMSESCPKQISAFSSAGFYMIVIDVLMLRAESHFDVDIGMRR